MYKRFDAMDKFDIRLLVRLRCKDVKFEVEVSGWKEVASRLDVPGQSHTLTLGSNKLGQPTPRSRSGVRPWMSTLAAVQVADSYDHSSFRAARPFLSPYQTSSVTYCIYSP